MKAQTRMPGEVRNQPTDITRQARYIKCGIWASGQALSPCVYPVALGYD
ncbi:MAG: hypothetical protein JWP34_5148 [Massilia sp.]|nr:hypothetical protein [Massilia sp.]